MPAPWTCRLCQGLFEDGESLILKSCTERSGVCTPCRERDQPSADTARFYNCPGEALEDPED